MEATTIAALLLAQAPAKVRPVVRLRLTERPLWVDDARQLLRADGRTWKAGAMAVLAPLYEGASVEEVVQIGSTSLPPSVADLTARQVAKLAMEAVAQMRVQGGRATVRTLSVSDVEYAIREHVKHVRANRGFAAVRTRLSGGHVANAYKYAADADRFDVSTDADGTTTWSARRGYADKRPHGAGSTLTVRVILPGQTDGRIVVGG